MIQEAFEPLLLIFSFIFPIAGSTKERIREICQGRAFCARRASKQFARARENAGLPDDLVMYCARHDFGTYALSHTGNLAAVMKTMGHKDVKTAMQYQRPEVEHVRDVINSRNARHNLRHKRGFEQESEKVKLLKNMARPERFELPAF